MIIQGRGNLLDADVEALVNTVNTAGIMGKGIALQFRKAYPAMFKAYARAAKAGDLHLGQMHVWPTGAMSGPATIINFPTKGHWRASSKLDDIDRGLDDLVRVIREQGIRSVAIPPLGCGNGGLDWSAVEPLIRSKLAALPGVDVHLYPPEGSPAAAAMPNAEVKPAMTPARAAFITLVAQYTRHAMGDPSLIETQKIAYFLQVAGEQLRLDFQPALYGPYADNLRHVLRTVEGHYLSGYGDGATPVQQAEPLTVMAGAEEAARLVIAEHPQTAERIDRVLALVEGFGSAYALELLATVHWLLDHGTSRTGVVEAVQSWSPRKGRMFTAEHIRVAAEALDSRGWTPRSVLV